MTQKTRMKKSFSVASTPAMLEAINRRAEEMRLTPPQLARLAISMFLERGIDYAKPSQETQRETISAD